MIMLLINEENRVVNRIIVGEHFYEPPPSLRLRDGDGDIGWAWDEERQAAYDPNPAAPAVKSARIDCDALTATITVLE